MGGHRASEGRVPVWLFQRMLLGLLVMGSVFSPLAGAEEPADLLTAAEKREDEGDSQGALDLYYTWLNRETGGERYKEILLHTAELEDEPQAVCENLAYYVQNMESGREKQEVLVFLARMEESLGWIEKAGRRYEKAAQMEAGRPDYSLYVSSAQLLLETGRTSSLKKMTQWIRGRTRDPQILISCSLLEERASLMEGEDPEDTVRSLEKIRQEYPASRRRPDLYLLLYQCASSAGLDDQADRARTTLERNFSESPELALLNRKAAPLTVPSRFLIPGLEKSSEGIARDQNEIDETGEEGAPRADEYMGQERGDLVRIQVGAYRDRRNAQDMIEDLKETGFDGRIEEAGGNGGGGEVMYKVVAESREYSGETFLSLLNQEGYNGFRR